ncbi:hypothetical protein HYC85_020046 [Camellia sinensis]|uniref:Cytochrome P450 n=1 Tax=Camellia sinensis TaxID=4442 RepID=A0A7J7GSI9_CAMSI|nr:hypothetical protein HYC85_020046 [Camellia sinensis]
MYARAQVAWLERNHLWKSREISSSLERASQSQISIRIVGFNWYTIALTIFPLLRFFKLFTSKQETPKLPLHQTLEALSDKYDSIILLHFGPSMVLIVTSPSAVEECFTKNDIVFANHPCNLTAKHLSNNYTTMATAPYGDLWCNLRCIMTLEIFSTAQLERTSGIRGEEVKFFANQLMKKNCGGGYSNVDLKSKFFELSSCKIN